MAQLLPAYSGLHGDFCCGCRDSCLQAEVECRDAFWLFSAPFYIPISRRSDEDSRRIDISLPLLLSTLLLYLLPLSSAVLKLCWFIKISTTTTTTATTASTHSTLQFACRLLLFFHHFFEFFFSPATHTINGCFKGTEEMAVFHSPTKGDTSLLLCCW